MPPRRRGKASAKPKAAAVPQSGYGAHVTLPEFAAAAEAVGTDVNDGGAAEFAAVVGGFPDGGLAVLAGWGGSDEWGREVDYAEVAEGMWVALLTPVELAERAGGDAAPVHLRVAASYIAAALPVVCAVARAQIRCVPLADTPFLRCLQIVAAHASPRVYEDAYTPIRSVCLAAVASANGPADTGAVATAKGQVRAAVACLRHVYTVPRAAMLARVREGTVRLLASQGAGDAGCATAAGELCASLVDEGGVVVQLCGAPAETGAVACHTLLHAAAGAGACQVLAACAGAAALIPALLAHLPAAYKAVQAGPQATAAARRAFLELLRKTVGTLHTHVAVPHDIRAAFDGFFTAVFSHYVLDADSLLASKALAGMQTLTLVRVWEDAAGYVAALRIVGNALPAASVRVRVAAAKCAAAMLDHCPFPAGGKDPSDAAEVFNAIGRTVALVLEYYAGAPKLSEWEDASVRTSLCEVLTQTAHVPVDVPRVALLPFPDVVRSVFLNRVFSETLARAHGEPSAAAGALTAEAGALFAALAQTPDSTRAEVETRASRHLCDALRGGSGDALPPSLLALAAHVEDVAVLAFVTHSIPEGETPACLRRHAAQVALCTVAAELHRRDPTRVAAALALACRFNVSLLEGVRRLAPDDASALDGVWAALLAACPEGALRYAVVVEERDPRSVLYPALLEGERSGGGEGLLRLLSAGADAARSVWAAGAERLWDEEQGKVEGPQSQCGTEGQTDHYMKDDLVRREKAAYVASYCGLAWRNGLLPRYLSTTLAALHHPDAQRAAAALLPVCGDAVATAVTTRAAELAARGGDAVGVCELLGACAEAGREEAAEALRRVLAPLAGDSQGDNDPPTADVRLVALLLCGRLLIRKRVRAVDALVADVAAAAADADVHVAARARQYVRQYLQGSALPGAALTRLFHQLPPGECRVQALAGILRGAAEALHGHAGYSFATAVAAGVAAGLEAAHRSNASRLNDSGDGGPVDVVVPPDAADAAALLPVLAPLGEHALKKVHAGFALAAGGDADHEQAGDAETNTQPYRLPTGLVAPLLKAADRAAQHRTSAAAAALAERLRRLPTAGSRTGRADGERARRKPTAATAGPLQVVDYKRALASMQDILRVAQTPLPEL